MSGLTRYLLPSVKVIHNYEREWIRNDVIAGIVLTALLIPAGIGYAEVSGLPPITGLYATIVPLVVYAIRRAVADPRARPRLVARSNHRRIDLAARCR